MRCRRGAPWRWGKPQYFASTRRLIRTSPSSIAITYTPARGVSIFVTNDKRDAYRKLMRLSAGRAGGHRYTLGSMRSHRDASQPLLTKADTTRIIEHLDENMSKRTRRVKASHTGRSCPSPPALLKLSTILRALATGGDLLLQRDLTDASAAVERALALPALHVERHESLEGCLA